MILTRRGIVVLGVVVLGVLNAALYGPRALNAVVAPAAIALVAAVLLVRRIEPPQITRDVPDDGHAGERHRCELHLETDTPFTGNVRDEVSDGLFAEGNEITTTIDDTALQYDVTFARRGKNDVGPARIVARDVLGLAEREFVYDDTTPVLVYPRVFDLTGRARHDLNLLPDESLVQNRGEFDSLREYERGDSLRDIDWKSSAKRADDELIVKEYIAESDLGTIRITAEATPVKDTDATEQRPVDAMADATASIASFLLEAGLSVGLTVPDGHLEPGEGREQRREILELLARTGAGRVSSDRRSDASLRIDAAPDGTVTVRMEDNVMTFDQLAGDVSPPTVESTGPDASPRVSADGGR